MDTVAAKAAQASFHAGLTPDAVVDAAVELTRGSHLFGWSMRDLARRLGVAPSVLYHHVGGKDRLCRQVVERVIARITIPPADLDWQEWFRTLLYEVGPLVMDFPGVAKWMLMHGPAVPRVMPIIAAGMGALRRAGFGEGAVFAYSALLNNAMLTISIGDDRLQHEEDGRRDHAAIMAELADLPDVPDEVRAFERDFLEPSAQGGAAAARVRHDYYRFIVDTTIAGLAVRLTPPGH
ncbi:TetR family transcriptional regulator [Nocardiopsis sp. RSe5-2]|uniref:TetR family transcriptional regulator n=1 Tax=Nocardiopsis endophytica TaxID=3018445 RepID=A0ABT4U2F9_9ACTN|nr:TetR family transcriptional regulator [Nocardiopsis endophytica]MDA2811126.1 TetR family transcriptional regulator [Nocardiopsis endophytica]